MKYFIYIVLFCCSLGYGQGEDYVIAQKALNHFPGYEKYRLIAQPNNWYIEENLKSFYTGEIYGEETVDLRNIKFSYADTRVERWEAKPGYWKEIGDKVEIIEDFEKIPKVTLLEANMARTYVRLSNPVFSEEGNCSIIFFEHFTNMNGTEAEGFIFIYKKVNNEWVFFKQFTVYIT